MFRFGLMSSVIASMFIKCCRFFKFGFSEGKDIFRAEAKESWRHQPALASKILLTFSMQVFLRPFVRPVGLKEANCGRGVHLFGGAHLAGKSCECRKR